ncbi:cytochrome c oxidase subunit 7A1, mitochondrial [Scaptodrosophila lebanonensis]|uniref:Cytochrome c oxidase subunit 7A1, mitochondrial n=1 Tax=Drosophila lebanonensis TaxID=7225 RepID=A0A6J2T3R9_DROLE|nr:cytochrome c oxidase subunit 7A1, mitochondrial [Scaptodrosophila lebanonensis]
MQRNLFITLRPLMGNINKLMMVPQRTFLRSAALMQGPAKCGVAKVPPKLAKLQKQFQQNDGKPVFLKGGGTDAILYKLTLVLCLLGTLGSAWLWFGYILA